LYNSISHVLKKERYDFVYGHGSIGSIANLIANKNRIPCAIRLYGTFLANKIYSQSKISIFLHHPLEYLCFIIPKQFLLITNDGTRGDEVYKHLVPSNKSYFLSF
jgi:hypothetical protein